MREYRTKKNPHNPQIVHNEPSSQFSILLTRVNLIGDFCRNGCWSPIFDNTFDNSFRDFPDNA